MAGPPIVVAEEVGDALAAGEAVVALESSIVAHGFPAPENLALGRALVAAVRSGGAVPAQVAVLDGAVRVGLDDDQLVRLTREPALKCSARDLGAAVARGELGATTVAATARIAAALGLRIFATGGIGGVHPGAGPADVSADLFELARSPVAVVASGAKSILDLAATLEALESLGVPVIGYGCDSFPAFHAADSGLRLGRRVDDAAELARILAAHWALVPGGGVLVCHPPPAEVAMAKTELDRLVGLALAEAEAERVRGGALTPFLLERLNRHSGGRTTTINYALALANAEAGARLARAVAALSPRR